MRCSSSIHDRFIYCGKLPEDLDIDSHSYLPISDHYGLDDLKEACSQTFLKNLNRSNVLETLILADRYGCSQLKRACLHRLHEWKDSMSCQEMEPLKADPALMFECLTYCGGW